MKKALAILGSLLSTISCAYADSGPPTDLELKAAYCLANDEDQLSAAQQIPRAPLTGDERFDAMARDANATLAKRNNEVAHEIDHLKLYLASRGFPGSLRPFAGITIAIGRGHDDFKLCRSEAMQQPQPDPCSMKCMNLSKDHQLDCIAQCEPNICKQSYYRCKDIESELPD